MTAAGLIFSNIHDRCIPEMTSRRTMASLPFGGRYRLVDFTLSNMVNSGINKVGIITHNNYRSLIDHIGTGKDWDLARRSGGVSYTDKLKTFSLFFVVLKAVMCVLPELAALGNTSYDEGSAFFNLYRYIGVMRGLCFIPVLAVGVVWLAFTVRYFINIYRVFLVS